VVVPVCDDDTDYRRTPLWHAADHGREGVVKVLLEREDVNPDQEDTYYCRTPLSLAAERGREGLVKILLEREDVNPNQADTKYGRTPLAWAAVTGKVAVVKILLERQDAHTTTLDKNNQTPLLLALSEGHDEISEMLRGDASPHTAGSGQGSPENGDGCAVDMQFLDPNSNTQIADSSASTAMPSAIHDKQEGASDPNDLLPKSVDCALSSAQPLTLPQPPPMPPRRFSPSPIKTDSHPKTRPTLSLALDWYFLIASFICLSAFLVYILPSMLSHIFSSDK